MADSSFMNDTLNSELESLRAIYADELSIVTKDSPADGMSTAATLVELCIRSEFQCARSKVLIGCTVQVQLTDKYPSIAPEVRFVRIRGLNEDCLEHLSLLIDQHLTENAEMPAVFDIFSTCQSFIDNHEQLNLLCTICLCQFSCQDPIIATDCGHFFHEPCLAQCLNYQDDELKKEYSQLPPLERQNFEMIRTCPVCRTKLTNVELNLNSSQSDKTQSQTSVTSCASLDLSEWRTKQMELNTLFEKQRSQGGIIDLEHEKTKWTVTEDTVLPVDEKNEETEVDPEHSIKDDGGALQAPDGADSSKSTADYSKCAGDANNRGARGRGRSSGFHCHSQARRNHYHHNPHSHHQFAYRNRHHRQQSSQDPVNNTTHGQSNTGAVVSDQSMKSLNGQASNDAQRNSDKEPMHKSFDQLGIKEAAKSSVRTFQNEFNSRFNGQRGRGYSRSFHQAGRSNFKSIRRGGYSQNMGVGANQRGTSEGFNHNMGVGGNSRGNSGATTAMSRSKVDEGTQPKTG